MKTTPNYVYLPDGYGGKMSAFLAEPVSVDGDMLQLQCMEPGLEYCRRWVHVTDYQKVLEQFRPPHTDAA